MELIAMILGWISLLGVTLLVASFFPRTLSIVLITRIGELEMHGSCPWYIFVPFLFIGVVSDYSEMKALCEKINERKKEWKQ